jgi:hypothetical protein
MLLRVSMLLVTMASSSMVFTMVLIMMAVATVVSGTNKLSEIVPSHVTKDAKLDVAS